MEPQIIDALRRGEYYFSPCRSVNSSLVWCAQDALVLKAATRVLTEHLAPLLSPHCYHITGRGGAKACVREVQQRLHQYKFVCRSDVNSYYASMDHGILRQQLADLIDDPLVLILINRMLARLDDVDGELFTVDKGINKGNPLSPLLGGVYLTGLDEVMGVYCEKHRLFYGRFMDDWIILCHRRNQLRAVVRWMNQVLDRMKMTKHPFKTYIGRIKTSGISFLGYKIGNQLLKGLAVAWPTWANHQSKLSRLYEQGASQERIGEYVKRWLRWVKSGVVVDIAKAIKGLHVRDERAVGFYLLPFKGDVG